MSIYSGFGTRQQESAYNSLVESIIQLLQSRILSNFKSDSANESEFKIRLLKTYDMLLKLEAHKYLPPKFSDAFKDLVAHIIKEQIGSPKVFIEKDSKNLTSTKKTFKVSGGFTERALTPTLPHVKTQIPRNLTPVKSKISDTGFLYARLTNLNN
jgi:hypothetical protein